MKSFSEKTLVQKLDRILRKQFGTNRSFREFSAGYGIADLVFASDFSFNKRAMNRRMPITNFWGLRILLSLNEEQLYTQEEIFALGNEFELHTIRKQLSFLVKANYLKRNAHDLYIKAVTNETNPIKKIVAIEVKLSDHKNGLMQAMRYQYFADESYLAILKEAEKNIDMDEFNKRNIGLILFDTEKETIKIKQPRQSIAMEGSINRYAKELMIEKFLKLPA